MPKFRVLAGTHTLRVPSTDQSHAILRRYLKGDVVETDTDLVERFNRPGSTKFERVSDNTPEKYSEDGSVVPDDGLDTMTVAELRAMADAEEVSLDGCTNKAQILKTVREAGLGVNWRR